LQLSIHKGGDWDLREITVGVTLIRPGDMLTPFDALKPMATQSNDALALENILRSGSSIT
jgi:hypothetical protein